MKKLLALTLIGSVLGFGLVGCSGGDSANDAATQADVKTLKPGEAPPAGLSGSSGAGGAGTPTQGGAGGAAQTQTGA